MGFSESLLPPQRIRKVLMKSSYSDRRARRFFHLFWPDLCRMKGIHRGRGGDEKKTIYFGQTCFTFLGLRPNLRLKWGVQRLVSRSPFFRNSMLICSRFSDFSWRTNVFVFYDGTKSLRPPFLKNVQYSFRKKRRFSDLADGIMNMKVRNPPGCFRLLHPSVSGASL